MRYVEARFEEVNREEAYRIFVTRSLQLAPQMKFLTKNYYEIINPEPEQEEKTGDEIAADVIARAGLKFGE